MLDDNKRQTDVDSSPLLKTSPTLPKNLIPFFFLLVRSLACFVVVVCAALYHSCVKQNYIL